MHFCKLIFDFRKKYQEQVIYETKFNEMQKMETLNNELQIGPEIMHEYKLINKGQSRILASELLIAWEKLIKIGIRNRDFLYLMDMPYTEGPIRCDYTNLDFNPLNLTVIIKILCTFYY
jgi:hypothetical protein